MRVFVALLMQHQRWPLTQQASVRANDASGKGNAAHRPFNLETQGSAPHQVLAGVGDVLAGVGDVRQKSGVQRVQVGGGVLMGGQRGGNSAAGRRKGGGSAGAGCEQAAASSASLTVHMPSSGPLRACCHAGCW